MDLPLPHKITLSERQTLTVTGVDEVLNLDENAVQLRTAMGCLWVYGQELKLKNLDPRDHLLSLTGTVSALVYEQEQKKGGKLSRLFG